VTIDEELTILEESLRRLKIDYDSFFGGGLKRPPQDGEWRVQSLVKKFSDGRGMNYAQRFRYNAIAQRYAIFSDLWRQKTKIKEEGYRRQQDALLGIQGLRHEQETAAAKELAAAEASSLDRVKSFAVLCADPTAEADRVRELYNTMIEARQLAGENAAQAGNFESFQAFVQKKTEQLRQQHNCRAVEYTLDIDNGRVKLKAKAHK
jgi:hypothetical protein